MVGRQHSHRANAIILLFSGADVFSPETESHDPAQQPLDGRGPAQQPQHPVVKTPAAVRRTAVDSEERASPELTPATATFLA